MCIIRVTGGETITSKPYVDMSYGSSSDGVWVILMRTIGLDRLGLGSNGHGRCPYLYLVLPGKTMSST